MAKNEGTQLKMTFATVEIDGLMNVGLTMNNNVVECTSFDSGGNRDILMGTSSWSMSATAFVNGAATENFNEAIELFQAKASVAVVQTYVTPTTGDASLAGSGFVTSIERTGEIDSVVTYNVTIEGTGALVNTPAV